MAFSDTIVSRPVSVVVPVVSSVAGSLREYICSVLPPNYLKDYHISTELPYRRAFGRRRFRPLTKTHVSLSKLPILSINVETTTESSDFSSGVTFWTSTSYLQDPMRLTRIIVDDENLRYLGYESERVIIRFTASFTVETELRAMELAAYLKRTLPVNQRVYLNDLNIETDIPGDILREIWSDMLLGPEMNDAAFNQFSSYLKRVTGGNVEPTKSSASGRISFGFAQRTNVIMNIGGTPTMSVNRDGNVVRNAQVDIPFEIDISVPVAYAYRQHADVGTGDEGPKIWFGDDGTVHYSNTIRIRPPENLNGELQLMFFMNIVTNDREDGVLEDATDFSEIIDENAKKLIKLYLDNNETDKVAVMLWMDGIPVNPASWSFDTADWTLRIKKPELRYLQKYSFGLYADASQFIQVKNENRRPQPDSSKIPLK